MLECIEMMFEGIFPRFIVDVVVLFVLVALVILMMLLFITADEVEERSKKK